MKSQDEAVEPAWFSPRWHARVLDLGARRLPHLGGGCPVYADPAGHVFCLCAAPPPSEEETPAEPHAVLDCFNSARDLAAFYAELLQMHHRVADSPGWVVIKTRRWTTAGSVLRRSGRESTTWQDPDRPQQGRLEIETDDLQATGELALRLGAARLAPAQSDLDVLADPEGHPFYLRPVR